MASSSRSEGGVLEGCVKAARGRLAARCSGRPSSSPPSKPSLTSLSTLTIDPSFKHLETQIVEKLKLASSSRSEGGVLEGCVKAARVRLAVRCSAHVIRHNHMPSKPLPISSSSSSNWADSQICSRPKRCSSYSSSSLKCGVDELEAGLDLDKTLSF